MRDRHECRSVGLTYVRIDVSKDAAGPSRSVDVLVDTGATHSMVPRELLESLGVVPVRKKVIRLGDGRTMERGLGPAYVRYGSHGSATWILFGEVGDAAVLGALTLEELSLQVDPESRTLRDVDTAMMVVAATPR
jgi:clan AA aspartic protease